jgi:serine/threonine protein phosphatase PrpC
VRFRVGARTDVGRVREGNEDSYMVHEPLFAVADGMGGHQGGEVASRLALETLKRVAESPDAELADVVREANRVVFRKAAQDPGLAGMGTTLTAVLAGDGGLLLAHVGDSRAYLVRDGRMKQLTKDHTVVQRLVDEGRLTQIEASMHPQRSILTNALGVDEEIRVDEEILEVRPGDRLLLCSDGLTGMIDDDRISDLLGANRDPQAACDALVDAANEAGGQDNVTAVVIDVLDGGPDQAATTAPTEQITTAPPATAETPSPAVVEPEAEAPPAPAGEEVPAGRGRRGGWVRRLVLWLLVPVILVAGALWAVKELFIDRQWYVGESNGIVALYRGIPAEPLGLDLSTVVDDFPMISAAEITQFPEYRDLEEGITAESEADARDIITQMQLDLEAQRMEQAQP